jgi:hypothetical protein
MRTRSLTVIATAAIVAVGAGGAYAANRDEMVSPTVKPAVKPHTIVTHQAPKILNAPRQHDCPFHNNASTPAV